MNPKIVKVVDIKERIAKEISVPASELLLSKHDPVSVRRGVMGIQKVDLDGKEYPTLFQTGIDTDGEAIQYEVKPRALL